MQYIMWCHAMFAARVLLLPSGSYRAAASDALVCWLWMTALHVSYCLCLVLWLGCKLHACTLGLCDVSN